MPRADSGSRPWRAGRRSGGCSRHDRSRVAALFPDLQTQRLTVRLARPGMQAAMARFLAENFEGHLERWSPPATTAFFTEEFWKERLAGAVEDFRAGAAVRFVLQESDSPGGAIIGTCNYTNIVRG